jgi:hypothetical protein
MGWPHLLHGTVDNGGRSLGTKTLESHVPHVTMNNGFLPASGVTLQIVAACPPATSSDVGPATFADTGQRHVLLQRRHQASNTKFLTNGARCY